MLLLSRTIAPPVAPTASNGLSETASVLPGAEFVTPSMPKFRILIERSEVGKAGGQPRHGSAGQRERCICGVEYDLRRPGNDGGSGHHVA
jgi:hypothetical protein